MKALDIESSVRAREGLPSLRSDDIAALAAFLEIEEAVVSTYLQVEPALILPLSVCNQCDATFTDDSSFCSQCGSPTVPPDNDTRISALEEKLQVLHAALYQKQEGSLHSPFQWQTISRQEKWAVTLGVWGRSILLNIAIWIGLFFLFVALGLFSEFVLLG